MGMTPEEQEWLRRYGERLQERFPSLVERLIVFGSKARGDWTADSDLDIVVLITHGDWRAKDDVAGVGHDLAIGTVVVPSLLVFTVDEWAAFQRKRAPFWQAVERDGVSVR